MTITMKHHITSITVPIMEKNVLTRLEKHIVCCWCECIQNICLLPTYLFHGTLCLQHSSMLLCLSKFYQIIKIFFLDHSNIPLCVSVI